MEKNLNQIDFRPQTFNDIVGQEDIIEYLKIKIAAFKKNGLSIGHILFLGFSGAGKTTLANVMANEMKVGFRSIMATRIKNWEDFYNVIKDVEENDVVFIDEIHALPSKIQEHLYSVMEDFKCTIEDKGLQRHIARILPRFTLIGATTHAGELNAPLLSRFQYKAHLVPYTVTQLKDMVINAGLRIYKVRVPDEIALRIAKLSRRTARNCYNILRNYIDVVEGENPGKLTSDMLNIDLLYKTLRLERLDPIIGLDIASRRYLVTMLANQKALGSRTIASMINEQENTLLYMIEPFLLSDIELEFIKEGSKSTYIGPFCKITDKGRRPTEGAHKYIRLCHALQKQGWFSNESLNIDPKIEIRSQFNN